MPGRKDRPGGGRSSGHGVDSGGYQQGEALGSMALFGCEDPKAPPKVTLHQAVSWPRNGQVWGELAGSSSEAPLLISSGGGQGPVPDSMSPPLERPQRVKTGPGQAPRESRSGLQGVQVGLVGSQEPLAWHEWPWSEGGGKWQYQ